MSSLLMVVRVLGEIFLFLFNNYVLRPGLYYVLGSILQTFRLF